MKKGIIFLSVFIFFGFSNQLFGQCETGLAESCCTGINGPFPFTTNTLQGSCNSGNDMGYVVLNVTTGGNLDVVIDGDLTSGFFDVAVFNIPPGTAPCDVTPADELSCAFAPGSDGCTSFGTTTPACNSNFAALPVAACDRIIIMAENFSGTNSTFEVSVSNDGDGLIGPPEADIPDAAACLGAPAFQIPNSTDVGGPNAFDGGVDIPGGLPAESGTDADACPNAGGGTFTSSCGGCVTATGMFDPNVAGVGTHTVTYEHYTTADADPNGNCCYAMDMSTIIVDADPDPQLSCPAGPFCTTDAPVPTGFMDANAALATNGAPTVAISGTGAAFVTADMFDPAAAGPGTFDIVYTLTSVNGLCEDVAMCSITVVACGCLDPCFVEYDATATMSDPAACITAVPPTPCDDGDPCTENDMEAIGGDGTTVCVACAGMVVAPPDPTFSVAPNPVPLCGGPAAITATTAGGTFTGSGAPLVVGTNIDPLLGNAGVTYSLTYTVSTPGGCMDSSTIMFSIVDNCDADGGAFPNTGP